MILFLTYHKVLRGSETEREFYTVRAEQLQRHLELIAEKGLRPLALHELLAAPGARPSPDAATSETRTPDSIITTLSEPAAPEDARTPPFTLSFDDGTVAHYE